MQHSLRHFGQLSQQWQSMSSVRPELCDYSFELPAIALRDGDEYA